MQSSEIPLTGNFHARVDEPGMIYAVKTGALAVFATEMRNGQPDGPRRLLFTAKEADNLFGLVPADGMAARGIIAVGLDDAVLTRLALDDVAIFLPVDTFAVEERIQRWVMMLGGIFQSAAPDVPPLNIVGGETLALQPGQSIVTSDTQLVWIKVRSGRMRWMGYPELTLDEHSGVFPLAGSLWLEAGEATEVEAIAGTGLPGWAEVNEGLDLLHATYHKFLLSLETRVAQAAFKRFQERARAGEDLTHHAFEDLTSLLDKPRAEPIRDRLPILAACRAVGNHLGIEIRSPGGAEDPTRLNDMVGAIARASRCRARRIVLEPDWYEHDCGALVAFGLEDQRPLALLPRPGRGYELVDPTRKTRANLTLEAARDIGPTAYLLYRPLPSRALKALDVLRFAFRGLGRDVLVYMLLGQAANILAMLTPLATGLLIDDAIPDSNRSLLLHMGFALVAATFGAAIFHLCEGYIQLRMEMKADAATQAAVWDRVLGLGAPFFRKFAVGDLSTRVAAVTSIRQKLSGTTVATIFSSLFALQYLILMFIYSPRLTVLAVALGIASFLITLWCGLLKYRVPNAADINAILVQLINGISKLRVASAETWAFAFWGKQFAIRQRQSLIMSRVEDTLRVINEVFLPFSSMLLFWYAYASGAVASKPGAVAAMSTGTFLAFNAAYGAYIRGTTRLSDVIIQILDVGKIWKMCVPIFQELPETARAEDDPGRLTGRIHVDRVSFRYSHDGPWVLRGVTIHAEPGEEVAIVGPSGCGKSTLVRLLLGFETPTSGKIFYDGKDLGKLDLPAVRRQFGTVLQHGRLMAGSVRENVSAGALLTADEVWEAIRLAGLEGDIREMPMGIETLISEGGSTLSGGQRQRLLLARAFALKPRIMIFDEATSALDNETQAIVTRSLNELNVTRIIIAHRLSTIVHADRIYVVEDGQIKQEGRFRDLAREAGLFQKLMARQMA